MPKSIINLRDIFTKSQLEGGLRSGILQKKIPGISNKMFTQTVRELEKDGLISRKVYPVVPPKVEYTLSTRGKSLENILRSLDKWGVEDGEN